MTASRGPLIFLVAGEPSGDALGGRLMAALKGRTGGTARFAGVGGERMAAGGLESLYPMRDLAVMGLAEVVPRIPRLLLRLSETVAKARHLRPEAVVTIDAPSFSSRVGKRLKGEGIPLIHYVAPTVWAYWPWRAAAIARYLDHLLLIYPFEKPYFDEVGLPSTFIGHPVVELGADGGDGPAFRARHGIGSDEPLLCVLPGSRHSEVSRLLPVFDQTFRILANPFPGLRAVVPTLPPVAERVAAAAAHWPLPVTVVTGPEEKYDAFAASWAALAASGSVHLELASAGVPMLITYKTSPLTAWLARRMLLIPYICVVNVMAGRAVIPEALQEACRPEALAEAVGTLLADGSARAGQTAETRRVVRELGLGEPTPSERAADMILKVIAEGPRRRRER